MLFVWDVCHIYAKYSNILKIANGADFDITWRFVVWKYYFQMKLSCP